MNLGVSRLRIMKVAAPFGIPVLTSLARYFVLKSAGILNCI